jgi:poly-gamma-glutamate synthesis protein (capsule biosynthesis protein)
VPGLTAARVDVCALAKNHVLDYGYAGLDETLRTLEAAAIQTVGTGLILDQARRPAIVDLHGGHASRGTARGSIEREGGVGLRIMGDPGAALAEAERWPRLPRASTRRRPSSRELPRHLEPELTSRRVC